MSARPPLSIVLVTRNRIRLLQRALKRLVEVADAECPDAEIVVIDGASTDGTVELLKSYGPRIIWKSEADKSVGEAVNKGFSIASGSVIRGLGDDDEVLPGGLTKPLEYLAAHPELDAVACQNEVLIEDAQGRTTAYVQAKFLGEVGLDDLGAFPLKGIFIPECLFFRREVITKCGGFDESFRYWGYLDWLFRLVKNGSRIRVIPDKFLITYQAPESDSIRANGCRLWQDEWREVQRRHNTLYWRLWHKLGGTVSASAALKWLVRHCCIRISGRSPRELLARKH